jgi:hypothetical protein
MAEYLRVLDARSVSVTFSEIGETLLGYDHSQTGIHAREVCRVAKGVWKKIYLEPSALQVSLVHLISALRNQESFPDPIHPNLNRNTLSLI